MLLQKTLFFGNWLLLLITIIQLSENLQPILSTVNQFPTKVRLIIFRLKSNAGAQHYKFLVKDGPEERKEVRCLEAEKQKKSQ